AADGGAWLAYTADGAYLLLGVAGEPARVDLLDAATLDLLDSSGPLYRDAEPLPGWGEGVILAHPADRTAAVGFAANVGDDPHVVAVASVHDGRLRVDGAAAAASFAEHVPGERVNGIALTDRELLVLDDDGIVTGFAREGGGGARRSLASGVRVFDDDELAFGGAVFARDGVAALDVIGDDGLV